MFSETLRDRKLVSLETDLVILVIGFVLPMAAVYVDSLVYGSAATINVAAYWTLFAK